MSESAQTFSMPPPPPWEQKVSAEPDAVRNQRGILCLQSHAATPFSPSDAALASVVQYYGDFAADSLVHWKDPVHPYADNKNPFTGVRFYEESSSGDETTYIHEQDYILDDDWVIEDELSKEGPVEKIVNEARYIEVVEKDDEERDSEAKAENDEENQELAAQAVDAATIVEKEL